MIKLKHNEKLYRVSLSYRYGKWDNSLYNFVEMVIVKDGEDIEEVITSLKERLYYDWEDAPIIEGVSYSRCE